MNTPNQPAYYHANECDLGEFEKLISQKLDVSDLKFAALVEKNIPIYDIAALKADLVKEGTRQDIMAEWAHILLNSAGVLVLKNAYEDTAPTDAATETYNKIIAREKEIYGGGADHFAAAGSNDRIWNSLQKLCFEDPKTYIDYFSNFAIDAVSEAWLGPNYQVTAQANVVRPGGKAQTAHRDYHLGFVTPEQCATYPAHVHELSPQLTLQGGIAHCDMPVESGPTKLLPFSQSYKAGYAAYRRDDFQACFENNFVQLPLAKGDALFFNPALFHAAGDNVSKDVHRFVNLLQVGSAFGRSIESMDRLNMCLTIYPLALAQYKAGELGDAQLQYLANHTGEGYPFPTNLDTDPPIGGLAPQSQKELFLSAVREGMSEVDFKAALLAQREKQQP